MSVAYNSYLNLKGFVDQVDMKGTYPVLDAATFDIVAKPAIGKDFSKEREDIKKAWAEMTVEEREELTKEGKGI